MGKERVKLRNAITSAGEGERERERGEDNETVRRDARDRFTSLMSRCLSLAFRSCLVNLSHVAGTGLFSLGASCCCRVGLWCHYVTSLSSSGVSRPCLVNLSHVAGTGV